MECIGIGAKNVAATVVSKWPTRGLSKRKRILLSNSNINAFHHFYRYSSVVVQVRCSNTSTRKSCVVVKQDFADEQDYIKAGGSKLRYVQMQQNKQNKQMDKQSKFSDKVPQISAGNNILDLVVIGCGPAGLALATESAKLGLTVGLIGPDIPFTNNYGVWEDEFKGVSYHSSKVERIVEADSGHNLVECEGNIVIPCRLATVASGAASGKLLQYELGSPRVSVQTAYGVEVEVENNPYDPNLMVFMDYRDYTKGKVESPEAEFPTFLYAMPMSPTRVFFEETCLASKDAMPFELLKKILLSRLDTLGIGIIKTYEEEWFYIPIGGSLPNTEQNNLAFGAAASMVHPATGYSVVRSLSEAPKYASAIANILKQSLAKDMLTRNVSAQDVYSSLERPLATREETTKIILPFWIGTYMATGY